MEKRTERLKYQAVFHTKVESHQLKKKTNRNEDL